MPENVYKCSFGNFGY